MKLKNVIIFLLFILIAFFSFADDPKFIGIEIPSQWGASWRFPVNSLDNPKGLKNFNNLHQLKDGDVLVIGTHSNPQVFGAGTRLVDWPDFWKHFSVNNPPKLGAVVICGCMIDVTDRDIENIRKAFGAGAVFTPRGSYGLPHILSTETILADLKYGTDLKTILQKVRSTHFMSLDPSVDDDWNLKQVNSRRSRQRDTAFTGYDTGTGSSSGTTGKYYIWINKFSGTGRIYVGSLNSFKSKKRYRSEWLAGMSQEYLEKEPLYTNMNFTTIKQARKFICSKISNIRYQRILGWGSVLKGDLNGKTYYINGLACPVPR